MSVRSVVVWCFALAALGTYLFVNAPARLESKREPRAEIPIERAFALLNAQNEAARAVYAKEIVGEGKKRGLDFDEDWKRDDVDAGPLPALLLRETAFYLEGHPTPLSLFLGSDQPINRANRFDEAQSKRFERIKKTGAPEFFRSPDTELNMAMFPDVATSEACITCHNEHPDSPKQDWRVGETMGAVTWSHPRSHVSTEELLTISEALLAGIERAYGMALDELSRSQMKPRIGEQWPRDGIYLPNQETFMKEVRARTAPRLLEGLFAELRNRDHAGE